MELRVNLATMVNQALVNARRQTDRLANLQAQAATGKRLVVPSDDPTDAVAVLFTKAQDQRLGMYLDNIQTGTAALDAGVSALRSASDIFTQAREIAIEGSQGGNSPQAQDALAQEVDQLLDRL